MIEEFTKILPIVTAIVGPLLGILLAIIGWFIRNAFKEVTERFDHIAHESGMRFETINQEVKGLRVDIAKMMEAQAVGHERFAAITEKIVELKASDEKLWEKITEAIERLTRLEEQKAPAPTRKRAKA